MQCINAIAIVHAVAGMCCMHYWCVLYGTEMGPR